MTVTYRGASIRLSGDFLTVTSQARRNWNIIFKVIESKDARWRLLYPESLSLTISWEIKNFPDKKKLLEFITTKRVLQESLKGQDEGRKRRKREEGEERKGRGGESNDKGYNLKNV